jgi:hypothetical protein
VLLAAAITAASRAGVGGTSPGAGTDAAAALGKALAQNPVLAQAAVVVPGGRLLSTALFNVLLTDDGRILAGMVPADALQAAASAP